MAKGKSDSSDKTPSGTQMVRDALDELGMDALPAAIQASIKAKHGVELSSQTISNYKFQIRRKTGTAGPGRGRRAAAPATGGGGLRVEDFEVLRGLVKRLGAAQVKKMVDVVS